MIVRASSWEEKWRAAALAALLVGCGAHSSRRGNSGGTEQGGQSAATAGGSGGHVTMGGSSSTGGAGQPGAPTGPGAGDGGTSATSGGGVGAAGDPCAEEASGSDEAAGPVAPPPSGYFVYLAETASLGKQVFHVRIHEGVVEPPVRLTPDAGVDAFMVSPSRHATITVAEQPDLGRLLTLVDFDEAGPTNSLLLNPVSGDTPDTFNSYGLSPDGTRMFAGLGQDLLFFDLRPSVPAVHGRVSGYTVGGNYAWSGSRAVFFGTAAGSTQRGVFMADPTTSPPTVRLLTADAAVGAPYQFFMSPTQERVVYYRKPPSGATTWYLIDLTAPQPAPVPLTSTALGTPAVSSLGAVGAWSPDSRYYLAEVSPGGLVLIDTDDPSSGQVISVEGMTYFTYASFSPDSKRLIYVASKDRSVPTQLYGVALHDGAPGAPYPVIRGTPEEQAVTVNSRESFGWIHGSRYVYFVAKTPSATHLADAFGCSGRSAAFESSTGHPLILNSVLSAPNARRAAFFAQYSLEHQELFVANIDADGNWAAPTRLDEPNGERGDRELTFLDADWLMYYRANADARASLHLAPRDASVPARRLNDAEDAVLFTYWVPDTQRSALRNSGR